MQLWWTVEASSLLSIVTNRNRGGRAAVTGMSRSHHAGPARKACGSTSAVEIQPQAE